MNQDQVKERLLNLDSTVPDFTVTFSGKQSKKVDGLYKPDHREIIIHNKNFEDDNALMYTAIHEFAHHIQFTTSAVPTSTRAHTTRFWDILHRLLFRAEEMGLYNNIFESDPEFVALTKKIKGQFLHVNADLMKQFGQLLMEAHRLCYQKHASFDDFVDRVLKLPRVEARRLIRIHNSDINTSVGYENMKTLAAIKDDDTRRMAEEAFLDGNSPDMVKAEFVAKRLPADKLEHLQAEEARLERSLDSLTAKLTRIKRQIREITG